MNTSKIL